MSNIFPNKNVHNLSYNEDAYSHKKKKKVFCEGNPFSYLFNNET